MVVQPFVSVQALSDIHIFELLAIAAEVLAELPDKWLKVSVSGQLRCCGQRIVGVGQRHDKIARREVGGHEPLELLSRRPVVGLLPKIG